MSAATVLCAQGRARFARWKGRGSVCTRQGGPRRHHTGRYLQVPRAVMAVHEHHSGRQLVVVLDDEVQVRSDLIAEVVIEGVRPRGAQLANDDSGERLPLDPLRIFVVHGHNQDRGRPWIRLVAPSTDNCGGQWGRRTRQRRREGCPRRRGCGLGARRQTRTDRGCVGPPSGSASPRRPRTSTPSTSHSTVSRVRMRPATNGRPKARPGRIPPPFTTVWCLN